MKCSVINCENSWRKDYREENVIFHAFPKNSKVLSEWIKACGKLNENINMNHARVCSDHFVETDYRLQDILLNAPKHKRRLKEGVVPSVNVSHRMKSSVIIPIKINLVKRLKKQESISDCLPEDELNLKEEFLQNEESIQEDVLIQVGLKQEELKKSEAISNLSNVPVKTEVEIESGRELKIVSLEAEVRNLKKKLLEKQEEMEKNAAISNLADIAIQTEVENESRRELKIISLEAKVRKLKVRNEKLLRRTVTLSRLRRYIELTCMSHIYVNIKKKSY